MDNRVMIIDFTEQGTSVYVKLEVYDAEQDAAFTEEVRFLGDMLYGDLLHAGRSPLTDSCREETVDYLRNYFGR